jgi:transposase
MAKDARSLPASAQEDLRRKAVAAVRSGMSQVEAARVFGVTRQAVGRWVGTARERGTRALRAKQRGRPPEIQLSADEAVWVRRQIVSRTPDQLALKFFLWTREAVRDLIEAEFGIGLSVWTIGRYLKAWGFTPQKPIRRAFEQNPVEVQRWLNETYPGIRAKALREKAEIYWGDETGMRSDHTAGRSYGRRGRTPVIRSSGRRFGCNMISAITNRGRLYFMVFGQEFRAPVFLRFLERLLRQIPRKIFLILDGHPVHRSRVAKVWLARNERRLRVFFLPGYSPELNPDELLNQDVKSNAVGRKPPIDADDLMANVRGFMRSKQRTPHAVQSYFRGRHVSYAAR